jgi:Cytochrome c554 and c-prime
MYCWRTNAIFGGIVGVGMSQAHGSDVCGNRIHNRVMHPLIMVVIVLLPTLVVGNTQRAIELPDADGQDRNGVATCAQSKCHDAARPWQTSEILQNEYRTWIEYSTHAEAWKVLNSPLGKQIGAALKVDPTRSQACLACHSDNVPIDQRGKGFRIEDGVGCEACHGGSAPWLENHVSMSGSREDYLAVGLYPTEFPEPRAALCMSCHMGTITKYVDHRMMAAGHPRPVFELDTYYFNMPVHHRDDADYRFRKNPPSSAVFWIKGQVTAAERWLTLIGDDDLRMDGIWLEPAFQDCHSCHAMYRHGQGSPQAMSPIVLNLSHLQMIRIIWPQPQLVAAIGELKRSMSGGRSNFETALTRIEPVVRQLASEKKDWTTEDYRLILMRLLDHASSQRELSYLEAEQITMGVAALLRTLDPEDKLADAVNDLFDAAADAEKFSATSFSTAALALRSTYGRH